MGALVARQHVLLSFIHGDGIALSGDNEISDISLQTTPNKRAIYIDSQLVDLQKITLRNLTVTGMAQLMTRGNNKKLDLDLDGLDIVAADSRNYAERPMKYGVNVYQGALTIYNYNPKARWEDSLRRRAGKSSRHRKWRRIRSIRIARIPDSVNRTCCLRSTAAIPDIQIFPPCSA